MINLYLGRQRLVQDGGVEVPRLHRHLDLLHEDPQLLGGRLSGGAHAARRPHSACRAGGGGRGHADVGGRLLAGAARAAAPALLRGHERGRRGDSASGDVVLHAGMVVRRIAAAGLRETMWRGRRTHRSWMDTS